VIDFSDPAPLSRSVRDGTPVHRAVRDSMMIDNRGERAVTAGRRAATGHRAAEHPTSLRSAHVPSCGMAAMRPPGIHEVIMLRQYRDPDTGDDGVTDRVDPRVFAGRMR
jgi:hypothetical protein